MAPGNAIAVSVKIDPRAARTSFVESTRCIITWSCGHARVPMRMTRAEIQMFGSEKSKLHSSNRVLWSAAATRKTSPIPPAPWIIQPIAKSAPPTITKTCSTSVQMTAFMPPRTV